MNLATTLSFDKHSWKMLAWGCISFLGKICLRTFRNKLIHLFIYLCFSLGWNQSQTKHTEDGDVDFST